MHYIPCKYRPTLNPNLSQVELQNKIKYVRVVSAQLDRSTDRNGT